MPTSQQGFPDDASQFNKKFMDSLKEKLAVPPQNYAKETERQLTFGEKAVGITFNVGGNSKVEAIKK